MAAAGPRAEHPSAACGHAACAHESTFGYRSDSEPLQMVALKVSAEGLTERARVPHKVQRAEISDQRRAQRKAYFGPELGWQPCDIISRDQLPDATSPARMGPLIIEEYDCTTVVRPHWSAQLDPSNNIVLRRVQP